MVIVCRSTNGALRKRVLYRVDVNTMPGKMIVTFREIKQPARRDKSLAMEPKLLLPSVRSTSLEERETMQKGTRARDKGLIISDNFRAVSTIKLSGSF